MGWNGTLKSGRLCGVARGAATGAQRRKTFGSDYAAEIAATAWVKATKADGDSTHAARCEPVTR